MFVLSALAHGRTYRGKKSIYEDAYQNVDEVEAPCETMTMVPFCTELYIKRCNAAKLMASGPAPAQFCRLVKRVSGQKETILIPSN